MRTLTKPGGVVPAKRVPLSTVWDVAAGVAIGVGVGLVVFAMFGLFAGVGAGLFAVGVLRAGVTVWNAK